jgi:hypothetical protein
MIKFLEIKFNLLKLFSLISLRLFHLKEKKRIMCLQLNTVIAKEKKNCNSCKFKFI